jgi:hypothetical protein
MERVGRGQSSYVEELFLALARRYKVMADVWTFGLHRVWKRQAKELCARRDGVHTPVHHPPNRRRGEESRRAMGRPTNEWLSQDPGGLTRCSVFGTSVTPPAHGGQLASNGADMAVTARQGRGHDE